MRIPALGCVVCHLLLAPVATEEGASLELTSVGGDAATCMLHTVVLLPDGRSAFNTSCPQAEVTELREELVALRGVVAPLRQEVEELKEIVSRLSALTFSPPPPDVRPPSLPLPPCAPPPPHAPPPAPPIWPALLQPQALTLGVAESEQNDCQSGVTYVSTYRYRGFRVGLQLCPNWDRRFKFYLSDSTGAPFYPLCDSSSVERGYHFCRLIGGNGAGSMASTSAHPVQGYLLTRPLETPELKMCSSNEARPTHVGCNPDIHPLGALHPSTHAPRFSLRNFTVKVSSTVHGTDSSPTYRNGCAGGRMYVSNDGSEPSTTDGRYRPSSGEGPFWVAIQQCLDDPMKLKFYMNTEGPEGEFYAVADSASDRRHTFRASTDDNGQGANHCLLAGSANGVTQPFASDGYNNAGSAYMLTNHGDTPYHFAWGPRYCDGWTCGCNTPNQACYANKYVVPDFVFCDTLDWSLLVQA